MMLLLYVAFYIIFAVHNTALGMLDKSIRKHTTQNLI